MGKDEGLETQEASPIGLRTVVLFQELSKYFGDISRKHGFEENWNLGEKFHLVSSELAEAYEFWRKHPNDFNIYFIDGSDKPEGFIIELADTFIRLFHIVDYYHLPLSLIAAMEVKSNYNKTRPFKHDDKI